MCWGCVSTISGEVERSLVDFFADSDRQDADAPNRKLFDVHADHYAPNASSKRLVHQIHTNIVVSVCAVQMDY